MGEDTSANISGLERVHFCIMIIVDCLSITLKATDQYTSQVVNLIRSLVKKEFLHSKFHAIFPVCISSQAFGVAWAEAGMVEIPMMRSFKQLSIVPFIRTTYFCTVLGLIRN